MHLAGPAGCCACAFHVFVVVVGVLILSGAVNTSIIGANGVMNRDRRRRRAAGLVPQAAANLRHHVPDHQPGRAAADRHHRAEPRRRVPARRSVRVRRGVELLPEVARRARAALSPARPGIQIPVQPADRRHGDPHRPGRDHAGAVFRRDREPVLEADRHHLRRGLHGGVLRGLHHFGARQRQKNGEQKARAGGVQSRHAAGHQRRRRSTRARAASWWRCAISSACRTCTTCSRKPTCGGTTSS